MQYSCLQCIFTPEVLIAPDGLVENWITKFTLIFDKHQYPIPSTKYPIPNTQYPIPSTWFMSHFGVHYKIKKGTGRSLFPLWYAKKNGDLSF